MASESAATCSSTKVGTAKEKKVNVCVRLTKRLFMKYHFTDGCNDFYPNIFHVKGLTKKYSLLSEWFELVYELNGFAHCPEHRFLDRSHVANK